MGAHALALRRPPLCRASRCNRCQARSLDGGGGVWACRRPILKWYRSQFSNSLAAKRSGQPARSVFLDTCRERKPRPAVIYCRGRPRRESGNALELVKWPEIAGQGNRTDHIDCQISQQQVCGQQGRLDWLAKVRKPSAKVNLASAY